MSFRSSRRLEPPGQPTPEQSSETHIWYQAPNLWRFETPGLLTVGDAVTHTPANGGSCVSLSFVLHSVNPGNFPTLQAEEEARIFDDIVSTFEWVR